MNHNKSYLKSCCVVSLVPISVKLEEEVEEKKRKPEKLYLKWHGVHKPSYRAEKSLENITPTNECEYFDTH